MNVIISSGENYDIALANDYAINAQKVLMLTSPVQERRESKHLDPAYIKGNTVNGKIYAVQ